MGLGVDPGYDTQDVAVQMQGLTAWFPAGQRWKIE
jgi:hypothetical protein